ncbi:hypothetical protein EVA_03809 [gut metagenome]|uniref:Uncharacterized protein n=1 Tax=gut metagenome TaxID=749906 RepID=J9GL27_9ZZZZ
MTGSHNPAEYNGLKMMLGELRFLLIRFRIFANVLKRRIGLKLTSRELSVKKIFLTLTLKKY